ncbi:hypothetical protein QLQ12_26305 [Actinoplanes sp. NEAU-A12]|uniref:F5/8 type C domain-containing protein n=1 Tax=Actinoplanes sandaracinus TaxID=3045177 RepID=A0ABT6WQX3_9ACTN|nr:discoidin domain-containing protein [Actinoplanes sandaracinus]MDI6102136.1 hypothetical protein [Actinoplanes sandaracinus]
MKTIAALLCALPPASPAPDPVHLAVDPKNLPITTGQCNARNLSVRLSNTSGQPVYADAHLSAPPALHLQRTLVSTWLSPGYTRAVPVRVSAATGTPAGTRLVRVSSGGQRVDVPVTVTAPATSAPLTSRAARVTASSFRAVTPICGAADGDPVSLWADSTNRRWPDWHQLDWDVGITASRVDVVTLPAAQGGLRDWDVQVWADGAWQTVAAVRGNTAARVNSTFTPRVTKAVRILTLAGNGLGDQSRIVEVAVS